MLESGYDEDERYGGALLDTAESIQGCMLDHGKPVAERFFAALQ